MIGFRVNYGETHAAILIDELGNRTDVTLACGPVMKVDETNQGRFAIIPEPQIINCFICQEKTRELDDRQMTLLVNKMADPESEARRAAMNSGRHPSGKRQTDET